MRYLVRRAGFYFLAIFVAITFNFLIPRLMAGDPASILYARFQGRIDARAFEINQTELRVCRRAAARSIRNLS